MKECPLCGTTMRLSQRMVDERLPGGSQTVARQIREWICPECDYFEEDDGEG
jgi:YgiT-type zinc finger domain-containing protein